MTTKQCIHNFADKFMKWYNKTNDMKSIKKVLKQEIRKLNITMKKIKKEKRKNILNNLILEKKYSKKSIKELKKVLTKKNIKKQNKKIRDNIISIYCNKTCKNTLFEKGNTLSDEYINKIKKRDKNWWEEALKALKTDKKNIFNDKTDVLINGFYEKIPINKVNKIKKMGAISGCAVDIDPTHPGFKKN